MKKLYLFFGFFLALTLTELKAQPCSFTLVLDTGCLPMPVLATANNTNTAPPVDERDWVLTTCSGVPVFTSAPGLNPTFNREVLKFG